MEVTGQQYASMLSYPSMNVLEGIKEEEEEEEEDTETESDEEANNEEDEKEREREERERREREEEEMRKKAEQEREEEIRKKNEELLSKNFVQRRKGPGSRMHKSSSEVRLQEDRPTIDDEDYVTATGTLRRRLIKRTPSVAVINETETAKVS